MLINLEQLDILAGGAIFWAAKYIINGIYHILINTNEILVKLDERNKKTNNPIDK